MATFSGIGIALVLLSVVLAMLPVSPFTAVINALETSQITQYIGWLIPVPEIVALLELWLVAISAFYAVSLLARWVKLIQG